LVEFAADDAVQVLVLAGAGGRAFVSGADISEFDKRRSSSEQAESYSARTTNVFTILRELEKPTIAKIQGYCMGGGVALALACDIRIAADDGKFAIPAAKLGLAYREDFTRWLVEAVGPAFAKEILYSGERFDAAEAQRIGLVNHVVAAAELDDYVAGFAKGIAAKAPLTVKASKGTINEILKGEACDSELIKRLQATCYDSADFKEGRKAFAEKRPPEFKGR
jgi:enoyl-CoA hydratase/carnithine racemase